MKIRAAVTRSAGSAFNVETVDLEAPRADEILVKLRATGVCHTDIVVRDGMIPTPTPVVLGHEGAGVVEQIGTGVTKVKPGDHVVMTFNSCGVCASCEDRAPQYCYEFFDKNFLAARTDGSSALSQAGERINANFFGQSSFAQYALCRENNIVTVPADVPLELLGPLACGVQTGAGAVLNALKISTGSSFAVFGAGSVGLSAVMAAKVAGAGTIVAVDTNPKRLELAKELGATHTVQADKASVVETIVTITGHGVQFALDTTGIPAVIRSAVESLAARGICGILGASGIDSEIVLNNTHFMTGGRRLVGIVEGEADSDTFIPALIDLYRAGRFPFDKLVRYYDFDDINEAVADSIAGTTIKPILTFS